MVQIDAEPEGALEKAGDALGFLKRRVTGDLERYKELVESRGAASGGWRGEVEQPGETTAGPSGAPTVR
jgi:hypothetical protein